MFRIKNPKWTFKTLSNTMNQILYKLNNKTCKIISLKSN